MQEANRPQSIKYSICCPTWRGVGTLTGGRYLGVPAPPHPDLDGGGGRGRYLGGGDRYLGGRYPLPLWTDWKHYLPHPSDAVGNNMLVGMSSYVETVIITKRGNITEDVFFICQTLVSSYFSTAITPVVLFQCSWYLPRIEMKIHLLS